MLLRSRTQAQKLVKSLNIVQKKSRVVPAIVNKFGQTKEYDNLKTDFSEKDELVKTNFSEVEDDEDHTSNTIEDGRATRFYYSRLQIMEKGCLICSALGLFLSFIQYDLEYLDHKDYKNKVLLWIMFFSTLILIPLCILRTLAHIDLMKTQNNIGLKETIFSRNIFPYLVLEFLVVLPGPMPFLSGLEFYTTNYHTKSVVYYKLNNILSIIILLRILPLVKVLLNETSYANYRAKRICKLYGCEANYHYALKCIMKETPLKVIFVSLLATVAVFGYALRICERPLSQVQNTSSMDFGNYWNSMWCIVVTISTVGYGDYYPITLPGRCVVFVVCIWGVCLISMMVVSLTNIIEIDTFENKALNILVRLGIRDNIKNSAAHILTLSARNRLKAMSQEHLQDQEKLSHDRRQKFLKKLKPHMSNFRKNSRALKDEDDVFTVSEIFQMNFDYIKDELKQIREEQLFQMNVYSKIAENLGIDLAAVIEECKPKLRKKKMNKTHQNHEHLETKLQTDTAFDEASSSNQLTETPKINHEN